MENSKKYKLYKSGKLWVVGAVAVAGVAVSANTTQVSADTVSNADAQAVKTTDATQNDKQVQLTASSTDATMDKATTDDATKTATVSSTAEKSTISTTSLQTKILNFIRQPIPDNIGVISQSVPVLFFGNIETARSATISLNPSDLEFRDNKQQILSVNKKRLVDRDVLHKKDTDYLSLEEAEKVYDSCINYFNKFPYKQWFNQLNRIVSPLGFSYFENSLIHLDITPWATYPKWANLVTKQEVLKASQNISDYIIQYGQLKYLFINGNGAFEHVKSYYSDINVQTTEIIWLDSRKCTVYTGKIGNCRFIAWSLYVQAALTINDRNALTMAISERL